MHRFLMLCCIACLGVMPAHAKRVVKPHGVPETTRIYHIGVCHVPPYVETENGTISGATVALWKEVADTLGLRYEYEVYPSVVALISGLNKGEVDIIITPGTVSRVRVSNFSVSVPFMTSRPGVLMKVINDYPMLHVLREMMTLRNLKFIFPVIFILLLFAVFIWLAERKQNPKTFHPGGRGIFDGIWWAVITMTTVGYGDTVPRTRIGRLITILWTFFAIILLFLITSEIASELTVAKFRSKTVHVRELSQIRTVSISNSGYADGLTINQVTFETVDSVSQAFRGVLDGTYDAFVFDMVFLNAELGILGKGRQFEVLPCDLNTQYLCFTGTKRMGPLFSRMNPVILQYIQTLTWKEILENYNIPQ